MFKQPDTCIAETVPKSKRDPRLDIFRGLGMFIILIAHIPNNSLAEWIPARFGFSDATEIFVFCSGAASALAFGRVFDLHGWLFGTKRILKRIWQIFQCHVGVFLAVIAVMAAADSFLPEANYLRDRLNLGPFLDAPVRMGFEFLSFSYVPNYFDILPMYIVILALVPIIMALARYSLRLAGFFSVVLWICAIARILDPSAESWSDRPWFFNPFAWQIVFFTGFAFVRGWLPTPRRRTDLLVASVLIVVVSALFSCQYGFHCYAGWGYAPVLGEIHEYLEPLIDKSHFGILRYVHFLAVAYLTFILAGDYGSALQGAIWKPIACVGRQTLAVFLAGLVVAQALGVLLDVVQFPGATLCANIIGCGVLYGVARVMTTLKGAPPKDGSRRSKRAILGASTIAAGLGLNSGGASEVHTLALPSLALGHDIATTIYIPDAPGPWATLYLLHGTAGNERDWVKMGQLAVTMDSVIARGLLPPTLVVMPDGGNSWYVDNPDPGGAGLMAKAMTDELPRIIDGKFPTLACANFRAIGGNSMGGYGALLHAMDHPEVFGAAFGLSTALWLPWPDDKEQRTLRPTLMFRGAYGEPIDPGRFNDWNIFSRLDAYARHPLKAAIRLAIGTRDFTNLRNNNDTLVAALAARGVTVPLSVDEGEHEWSLWARQLPDMLAWLGTRWMSANSVSAC